MSEAVNILQGLASAYERSQAGRTGAGARDFLMDVDELLRQGGCEEGDRRELAEGQLKAAEAAGIVVCELAHKRDKSRLGKVRLPIANEALLYRTLGRPSPTESRAAVAAQFKAAATIPANPRWRPRWAAWCEDKERSALEGKIQAPFTREPSERNAEILALLPKLLAWEGESLRRFVSCVLCGSSKALETQSYLADLLAEITRGEIKSLEDLGILENPRSVLAHGPLELFFENGASLNFGILAGPVRISKWDIDRAVEVRTSALRLITIENETTFYELAKLGSGELLICTSFPGAGTIALLRRLPANMEYHHFGDSDEAGFEILKTLREKSGRNFHALHMERGRDPCEQEALGRPPLHSFPFYDFHRV